MIFTPGKSRKIIHCNLMQSALGVIQNPLCAVVIHNTKSCSNVAWSAFQSLRQVYQLFCYLGMDLWFPDW